MQQQQRVSFYVHVYQFIVSCSVLPHLASILSRTLIFLYMCVNCAIRFAPSTSSSSNFGGITIGTTYFVQAIPSSTTFSISVSRGGSQLTLTVGKDADFRSQKPPFVSYLFRLRQHERAPTRNFHKQLFFVGISSVCGSARHQRLFQGKTPRRLCLSCSH